MNPFDPRNHPAQKQEIDHPFVGVRAKAVESPSLRRWSLSPRQRRMADLLWMVFGGAAGGAVGTLLSHTGVILLHYSVNRNAGLWLKGPHGSPFFDLSLSTALFYAGLGSCLYAVPKRRDAMQGAEELVLSALRWPWRRELFRGFAIGFMIAFSVIAIPMAAATRLFSWGEGPAAPPTLAWVYLILGVYTIATGAAAWSLGLFAGDPRSRRDAFGAVLGILGAYLLQLFFRFVFPNFGAEPEGIGWIAPPSALYSGVLWGGMLGLGIAASGWSKKNA